MTRPILSVEDLTVSFTTPAGEVPAVRGISFHLEQGEAVGIVGESGSGKTVTCRALLRLLPLNATIRGRIDVGGVDLVGLKAEELIGLRGRQIAMIFQNPSSYLDPLMRIGAQIGEGLRFHFGMSAALSRERAIELLERVRIPDPGRRVESFPHELSGGMKQRGMIAGALACHPEILVADEPTTALDVTVQARILALLGEVREQGGLSLILVSHDLGVIASVCDRVLVMNDGRIVEEGPTELILSRPKDAYTRELIAANPSFEPTGATRAGSDAEPGGVPDPILDVEGLSVTYGRARSAIGRMLRRPGQQPVHAVREVNFSVREGEILGIVGESGSGKTTLGRAVVGLTSPSEGQIFYRGIPIGHNRADTARRRSLQMVFQDPFASLNPRLTMGQTLSEPLQRHRLCPPDRVEERVRELMASVELSSGLRDRRPHEMSGGQCQRVAIARALSVEPRVLVADEVTSALDVTIQKQILGLLRTLREDLELTILLISHDLGVVHELCDRIVVMSEGRIVEQGPADGILFQPREPYTKELIAAVPRLVAPGIAMPSSE
jgi:peptide/nickel transport system ATP-binding protein